jgi:transposase
MDSPLHDIDEVGRILGVGKSSVQKYIESGKLKGTKMLTERKKKNGHPVKPVWHCTDEQIEDFKAKRAAEARIKEKAERFGAGMTEPPCEPSDLTTGSTAASS